MADGFNFQMNPSILEELEKQKRLEQLQAGSAPMDAPVAPPIEVDKAQVLSDYRERLMQKIQASEGNLALEKEAYDESQKAGSGWGGGARKGLAVFGDMLSGMAGKPGASGTTQLMKQFAGEKKAGEDKYSKALEKESGYLDELDKMDVRDAKVSREQTLKDMMDPKSKVSADARANVLAVTGKQLPESFTATQADIWLKQAPALGMQKEKLGYQKGQDLAKSEDAQAKIDTKGSQYKTELENKLRKEINSDKETKQFIEVKNMLANVREASKGRSAADDLALIFSYMKILDPGSVVREGEFANAQNTAGIPERIVVMRDKILSGNRLSSKQRIEFVRSAETVFNGREKNMKGRYDHFRKIAKDQDLNIDHVIYDTTKSGVDMDALSSGMPGNRQMSQAPQSKDVLSSLEDDKLEEMYRAFGGK